MKKKARGGASWRVGDVAKAAGVSADTLRHYEKKGLLRPQRSHNGYREYPDNAIERVRLIRQALAVGFTLDELSGVFQVFDRGGAPCHEVRSLAARKLADIENHLEDVIAVRNELRESLKDWDKRLAKTASGQRAGLLIALGARDSVRHTSTRLLLRKPGLKKEGKKK